MSLDDFYQWLQNTPWATGIRESSLLFPVIETIHVLGLALSVGTIAVVDLRLLGLGMRRQPVTQLAGQLARRTLDGLAGSVASGIMLFLSEALKCYACSSFQLKMLLLCSAILFHVTIYRRFTMSEDARIKPWRARLIASVWVGFGPAGRAIGFE